MEVCDRERRFRENGRGKLGLFSDLIEKVLLIKPHHFDNGIDHFFAAVEHRRPPVSRVIRRNSCQMGSDLVVWHLRQILGEFGENNFAHLRRDGPAQISEHVSRSDEHQAVVWIVFQPALSSLAAIWIAKPFECLVGVLTRRNCVTLMTDELMDSTLRGLAGVTAARDGPLRSPQPHAIRDLFPLPQPTRARPPSAIKNPRSLGLHGNFPSLILGWVIGICLIRAFRIPCSGYLTSLNAA